MDFALNPSLDAAALGTAYLRQGRRLQIENVLSPQTAQALLDALASSEEWRLAVNRGEQILDFSEAALAAMTDEQQAKLVRAVELGGRYQFQFRYDALRVKQEGNGPPHPSFLADLADFLSAPPQLDFLRTVTGASDIAFADAHASRYRPGHFLTTHDDRVEEMGRKAAYVLNLCAEWRADWGGLLLFYDRQGNIERGYTPGFNVLNLFAVPQPHSVSWVTPLAGQPRYAITGWLRTEPRLTPRGRHAR